MGEEAGCCGKRGTVFRPIASRTSMNSACLAAFALSFSLCLLSTAVSSLSAAASAMQASSSCTTGARSRGEDSGGASAVVVTVTVTNVGVGGGAGSAWLGVVVGVVEVVGERKRFVVESAARQDVKKREGEVRVLEEVVGGERIVGAQVLVRPQVSVTVTVQVSVDQGSPREIVTGQTIEIVVVMVASGLYWLDCLLVCVTKCTCRAGANSSCDGEGAADAPFHGASAGMHRGMQWRKLRQVEL